MVFRMTKKIGDTMPARTIEDVYEAFLSETGELADELQLHFEDEPTGEDGIKGEIVDVIQCLVDLYQQYDPNATEAEFSRLYMKKLEKWRSVYSDWDKKTDRERYPDEEHCPNEGCNSTLRGKGMYEGGGVECRNPECNYWFCY